MMIQPGMPRPMLMVQPGQQFARPTMQYIQPGPRPMMIQPRPMVNPLNSPLTAQLAAQTAAAAAPKPNIPDVPDSIVKTKKELAALKKKEDEFKKMEANVPKAKPVKVSAVRVTAPKKAPEKEEETYDKAKAIEDFKALLLEKGVKSDQDWKAALPLIIFDRRYKKVKSMKDRKRAFEAFCKGAVERERDQKKNKKKKAKEDFLEMLRECDRLETDTRYRELEGLVGDDPRYRAIEERYTREDVFLDYIRELEDKEKQKKEEKRQEFADMLRNMEEVTFDSRWKEIEPLLEDREIPTIDRKDRLRTFSEVVRELRDQEKQRREDEEDRAAEGFEELLRDLLALGKFHGRSRWTDVQEVLEELTERVPSRQIKEKQEKQEEDKEKEDKDGEGGDDKDKKEDEDKEAEGEAKKEADDNQAEDDAGEQKEGGEEEGEGTKEETRYSEVLRVGGENAFEKHKHRYDRSIKELERKLEENEKRDKGSDSDSSSSDSEDERERDRRKEDLTERMEDKKKEMEKTKRVGGQEFASRLFEKLLDKLDDELKEDRRALKYILENLKLKVTSKDTVEGLTEKCTDVLLSTLTTHHIPLLFQEEIARVSAKEEKKRKRRRSYSRSSSRSRSRSRSRSKSNDDSDDDNRGKKRSRSRSASRSASRKRHRKSKDKKKSHRKKKDKKRSKRSRSRSSSSD